MSDGQGRPASTMSAERRYGIAISVALILGGIYWALTGATEGSKTEHSSYDVDGQTLLVEGSSATVEVRSGEGDQLKVERRFERNALGSDPKAEYKNGTLKLKNGSCGFMSFGCETTYVLTVPSDVQLTVRNESGKILASGLPGGAELKTSSGKIEAHDIGGTLRMESSSGRIEAAGLTASSVTTETSSGDTELEFVSPPQSIDSQASSGDVEIVLPEGSETYKVDTVTSSGDNAPNVKADASSTRTITVKTSSGDVAVEYRR
ncbi:DUF4097 family beta strand repeat protein [Kribbella sandramycini]|uniref:DUF4097 family beta strand repeat protein n=1 Tax=Kribbella sandramycini TaxID=60450 RepID=A0A7Y4L7C0_9ACTN|nr:DUF4097 family beta strand repeat-containing protein [Kribbella sandramycini]MBB6567212.1 hypothetical protein [Kribbella sandramycini]NOL45750.1 DUF4097 family beta strand repeat protein [Kribbella sandramycini]